MPPGYVLVADAEPDLERDVRAALAKETVTVRAVRDGAAAHDILAKEGRPALLVTNLSLPKRDGFAVLRGLRRVDPSRLAQAIAVAASPQLRQTAERMRAELGPLVVESKPLSPRVIQRAYETARSQDAEAAPSARARAAQPAASPPLPASPRVMKAPFEPARLERIREMGIVENHDADAELQELMGSVTREFDVPIALISIVLEDRQWFKSYAGLEGRLLAERGTPRDWAFCQHVVEGRAPLVVPDAREHPLFTKNPLVLDGSVTGYAGAPLTTSTGEVLGTLCIVDQGPLRIGAEDLRKLVHFARRVAGELEVRALRRRGPAPPVTVRDAQIAYPYLAATLSALDNAVILLGADGRVVLANPAVRTMFGVESSALFGKTRDQVADLLAGSLARPEEHERLTVHANGPWVLYEDIEVARPQSRFVRIVGRPLTLPDGIGQLVVATDVTTDVLRLHAQEELASHDALTGAYNRRGGTEMLARELARAVRFGTPLSVATVDIDHFKRINDTFGHDTGDEVLRFVVQRVRSVARSVDVVARWGGDELLVLLPGTELEGARTLGERLRGAIAEVLDERVGPVSLSIGVTERRDDDDATTLLARADAALYAAKRAGRNRVASVTNE